MRVAEWFTSREDEMVCRVEFRAGSVSVVDDVVEREDMVEEEDRDGESGAEVTLTGGDTTLELLGSVEKNGPLLQSTKDEDGKGREAMIKEKIQAEDDAAVKSTDENEVPAHSDMPAKKKRKRKRTKSKYDPDDIPEARIRWVKTIEIAISLKA